MSTQTPKTGDWVPEACTLPTQERPLRVAEFDALFASALLRVERLEPTRLRLVLAAEAEATARDLTGRETACCSFFRFDFGPSTDGQFALDVHVPVRQVTVLDALADQAAPSEAQGARSR
jgi:hypothetical protein